FSALGLAAVAFAFTAWFLDFPPLAQRPWLLFSFVFLVDLAAIGVLLFERQIPFTSSISGLTAFGLLALWTTNSLTAELLNGGLAFYSIFAVLHSALPVLLERNRDGSK